MMYQLWNFLVCAAHRQLCNAPMLAHHAYTFGLAYMCVSEPYGHYYIPFFFGLVELTNVPLTIIEVLGYFPTLEAKFPVFKALNEYCFVASFFVIRVFMWSFFSYEFVTGNIALLYSDALRSPAVVYFYLVGITGLSFLQAMWAWKILVLLLNQGEQKGKNQ